MPARPQTIQIYLPGGDPEGIRVAELTTRIVQVVEVPRKQLDTFLAMPESGQVALYFLFGTADSDDTGGRQTVYIGQTGSPRERLPRHRREKTFWTRAMVVISRTNNLTQTHVGLLEWMAIARCREIRRYRDANGDSGSEPYVPAPMRADCEEVFDTASTLLTTLGSPIFEPFAVGEVSETAGSPIGEADTAPEVFLCKRGRVDARARYENDGLVVLKGSAGPIELQGSGLGGPPERRRRELLADGILVEDQDRILFTQDYPFPSPSSASGVLAGVSSNGWIDWATADGRTLDAVVRRTDQDPIGVDDQASQLSQAVESPVPFETTNVD